VFGTPSALVQAWQPPMLAMSLSQPLTPVLQ